MTIRSMTGFARADGEDERVSWHWELRTVNGRGFDVRVRLPSGLERLEQSVRERLAKHVRRGNCQVSLQLSSKDSMSGAVSVNEELLEQVLAVATSISDRANVSPPTVDGLLAIRGVLEFDEREAVPADGETEGRILKSLENAVVALDTARRGEGARLRETIRQQIERISELAGRARNAPARSTEAIRARLAQQVSLLLDASAALDPDRLHQEAAIIAAKADIQEELDRISAHIQAAHELLDSNEPVGRKLDFLSQEFNRESNTICSKSNDSELSSIGLELKAVVDQMREQVQNIE